MIHLAEGDFRWGGSVAWARYPRYTPSGGYRWGGSVAVGCEGLATHVPEGDYRWGGSVAYSQPGAVPERDMGGARWGGSVASTFTAGPCEVGPCCCAIVCPDPLTLCVYTSSGKGKAFLTNASASPYTTPNPFGGTGGYTFTFAFNSGLCAATLYMGPNAGGSCRYTLVVNGLNCVTDQPWPTVNCGTPCLASNALGTVCLTPCNTPLYFYVFPGGGGCHPSCP